MPAHSVLPDVPTLLRELERIDPETGKPITRTKLAAEYGVSPQAISMKLRGVVEQNYHRRVWPWEVQSRHKQKWVYKALTYYQISLTKDRVLTKSEQGTLVRMLEMIETLNKANDTDLVVDYDPTTAAGFYLRPREAGDPDTLFGNKGGPAPVE